MCLETIKLYLNQLVPVFATATVPALLAEKQRTAQVIHLRKVHEMNRCLPVPSTGDFDYTLGSGCPRAFCLCQAQSFQHPC